MSCNGCRVLRKGCSENCILRPCLQWIDSPQAQGHATVFVAKFFGRAGLMSFLSSVLDHQRPALFQSLLFEACGRTVNPVTGAVGLLWTGNWHACQAAVQTVLRGGTLRPIPEFVGGGCTLVAPTGLDEASEAEAVVCTNTYELKQDPIPNSSRSKGVKRRCVDELPKYQSVKLGLSTLKPVIVQRRAGTPSRSSEESVVTRTTDCFEIDGRDPHAQAGGGGESKLLLNLFN